MLWAVVWTLLGVGTLVGAFFLGRDVLRRGTRLMTALEEAGSALALLDEKVTELESLHVEPEPYAPDEPAARARLAELRTVREERAAARRERRAATIAAWQELTR